MTLRNAALTIAAAAFSASTALSQGAPPWTPLAGEWKLNAALSDARPKGERPDGERQRMRGEGSPARGGGDTSAGPGGAAGAGAGGGEFGMGDGGGFRGGRGGRGAFRGRGGSADSGARPPAFGGETSLLIGLEEKGVRVSADGGTVRILAVDGPPVERKRGPLTVTETVKWETSALLVHASAGEGPSSTEGFAVGEDGRLVHSLTRVDRRSGEERTTRWVYDRVVAGVKK